MNKGIPQVRSPDRVPGQSRGGSISRFAACASLVAFGALATAPSHATIETSAPPPPTSCGAPGGQNYAIAAGSLDKALATLALQANLQIVYSPELAAGAATRGVVGPFSDHQALQRLLAGTGLTSASVNSCTFILHRAKSPARSHEPTKSPGSAQRAVRTLPMVTISGSLINNANIQTATPTQTISAASIEARSFNNVAEVLQNSVFANGSVQGPQHSSSFTQGARAINLYGLGPQFTLILVDGKPLADFGRLYNGSSSFNNLSNIPLSMVERIDVMPGGSSSIYGSQAVAGVINIITRQHMDHAEISVRAGTFADGAGDNQRIALGYGHDFGRLDVLAAFEFEKADPIWAYDRKLTNGASSARTRSPQAQSAVLDYGTALSFTGNLLGFVDPPGGCDQDLFGGNNLLTRDIANPGRYGRYCGTHHVAEHSTVNNQSTSYRGMLKLRHDNGDQLQIRGNFMVNWQRQRWYPGLPLWQSAPIVDADSRHILVLGKTFAPEELPGGASGQMERQLDLLYRADIGASGQFGQSSWDWDVYYLRSGGRTELVRPLPLVEGINAFFGNMIGPAFGIDPFSGLALYRPDYTSFFRAIAPAQYAGFSPNIGESSKTWINNTRATLTNTSMLALPGGNAGFAFLVETGSEAWQAPITPLFAESAVYLHTAVGGGGRRSHLASAFELNLPILRQLTADLSGRVDRMSLHGGSDNRKFTYRIGLEYRPVDTLLLRGNYSTVFKAPDLSASFLAPSRYYDIVTDEYLCALSGNTHCAAYPKRLVQGSLLANTKLRPTTAQTWTAGAVWSPASHLNLSLDYLHIAIRDVVAAQDPQSLMRQEAQCRLDPRKGESPACRSITDPLNGTVRRAGNDGRGNVIGITTQYANLARESVDSIAASGRYRFAPTPIGRFDLQFDYNVLLHHDYQLAPGEPMLDRLADPTNSYDFRDILNGSLGWTAPGRRWRSTLYGRRLGSTPNLAAINYGAKHPDAGRVDAWITFNWSLAYAPSERINLTLLVNNIANKMPPKDSSFTEYPYFNYDSYDIYGREVMLQASVRWGDR